MVLVYLIDQPRATINTLKATTKNDRYESTPYFNPNLELKSISMAENSKGPFFIRGGVPQRVRHRKTGKDAL